MTLKSDPKKSQFLRNMHFLCDAIDLKQSVENTLKAQGKLLTTVLDEFHFIVKLYSFPLPLVPQENPSFPKASHLPLPGRTTSKTPPSFSVNPTFLRISRLPGQNQQNDKQPRLPSLPFKISLKDTSFHISINSLLFLNFLSNFYIPQCEGKIFKFMEFIMH